VDVHGVMGEESKHLWGVFGNGELGGRQAQSSGFGGMSPGCGSFVACSFVIHRPFRIPSSSLLPPCLLPSLLSNHHPPRRHP